MRIFTPLYDKVLEWARHRHATRYLIGLSVAEATVFPVPPDVMLAPMVLAQRRRAWRLAALTTLASVLGGLIGYAIGSLALGLIYPWIEAAGYHDAYGGAVEYFRRYGVWFVILAGFSPIPYKIITIAAGALGMPVIGFILGSVIGRGARFFLVAGLIWLGGERMAAHLRRYVDVMGWAMVALTVAVIIYWWL